MSRIRLTASVTERLDRIATELEQAGRPDMALAVDQISDHLASNKLSGINLEKALQIGRGNLPPELEKFDLEKALSGLKPATDISIKDFGLTPTKALVPSKPVLIKDFPVMFTKNKGWINAYTIAPEGTKKDFPWSATYHEGNIVGIDTGEYQYYDSPDDYQEMFNAAKKKITEIIDDLKSTQKKASELGQSHSSAEPQKGFKYMSRTRLTASVTERLDRVATELEQAGRPDLALAVDQIADRLERRVATDGDLASFLNQIKQSTSVEISTTSPKKGYAVEINKTETPKAFDFIVKAVEEWEKESN